MSENEKDQEQKEPTKESNDIAPPSISLMKKGDYTVHVLIEDIKNLISKKDNILPSPIVKVTVFNKSQRTPKLENNCDAYTFNEHMYFDEVDLSLEILDSSKIKIEVYDYNNSDREDYFGIYEFDFEYIYSKPEHCLRNLWLALANPEANDITKVNGYLKLSISVLSSEDEKIELIPDKNKDSECMVPPQIKISYKQITINILKAENLPDMDVIVGNERQVNRRCNGYVQVNYLGISKQTKIVDMEKEVIIWNEKFDIAVAQPAVSQKIVFNVKDHNKGYDQTVGSFEISINDILANKYSSISCMNIYGTLRPNDRSEEGKMMNENAEIGTRWKGRLYLSIEHRDVDTPVYGSSPITDPKLLEQVGKISRKYLWSIYVKVLDAFYLPEDKKEYGIKIAIQDSCENLKIQKAVNRSISWNICKSFPVNTLTYDLDQLPDFIIYLIDKKGREISFQRIKLSKFHLNDDLLVIKLFPEPCTKIVKDMMNSGIVRLRIKLFNREKDPQEKCDTSLFKDVEEMKGPKLTSLNSVLKDSTGIGDSDDLEDLLGGGKKESDNQVSVPIQPQHVGEFKNYIIVANIYMTRYMVSGDNDGTSDPYAQLTIFGVKKKTTAKKNCINGIWNECLVYDSNYFNLSLPSTYPCMLLKVKDDDPIGADLLGYAHIWLTETSYAVNSKKPPKPRWHQLFLEKSNQPRGQILLGFSLFDEEHAGMVSGNEIEPETVPYTVEINALGLRELKPLGFIGIKKPYISFDLNSINVSSKKGESYAQIKTQPNDTGSNPNINSIIKFNVNLPKENVFTPDLQCNVYDHVLGGMLNNLLGVFMLNVNQLIKETKKQFQEEYDETNRIEALLGKDEDNINNINNINNIDNIDNINNKKNDNSNINTDLNSSDSKLLPETDSVSLNILNEKELDAPLMANSNSPVSSVKGTYIEMSEKVPYGNIGSFLCMKPKDLKNLYQGNIDKELIQKNKNNSSYFIIKPSYKNFEISGMKKSQNNPNNTSTNASNNKNNEKSSSVETDEILSFLLEDASQIPDEKLYFPLGYNKIDNPLRVKKSDTLESKLKEDKGEKEGLLEREKKSKKEIKPNNKKHYRRIYYTELENVKEIGLEPPFMKCYLIRNKFEDKESQINDLFEAMRNDDNKIIKRYNKDDSNLTSPNSNESENDEDTMKNFSSTFDLGKFGYFKGLVRIARTDEFNFHENYIKKKVEKYNGNLPKSLKFLTNFEDVGKNLLVKHSVVARLYVLEMRNLAKKDQFSESDPYIKILIGDKEVVNESKNHQDDQKDCKWYKYYDILTELPGTSKLKIQVFDYDPLFSDDFIGETVIDLEDRYFDNRWQALENKPIEVRSLYNPDLPTPQGNILLFLEIFDKSARAQAEPWNIDPQPKSLLELRLIVYETEDMEMMDVEDTSDIYVAAFVDGGKRERTDIHYRCQTGVASFNWRLLISTEIPRKSYDLNIQAYDNDILARDDFISGARLNLKKIINDVNDTDTPLRLSQSYYRSLSKESQDIGNIEFVGKDEDPRGEKFWVQTEKNGKKGGRILCSLEIVPEWYAKENPVGKGRDEPNYDPYLPPPVGRIKFSLNPITMFNQLVGPRMRKKVCCWLCCILLILYIIFVIPYIVYFISGELINPFNYSKKGKEEK